MIMESAADVHTEVHKQFSVPAERLYRAWTREEDIRRWWHQLTHLAHE